MESNKENFTYPSFLQGFVGVDIGLNGGITILSKDGEVVELYDMPIISYKKGKRTKKEYDLPFIYRILDKWKNMTIGVERMQSLPPGIRIQASFSLGYGQGIFEGILTSLGASYEMIIPKTWQKIFEISKNKGDTKVLSLITAEKLFPNAPLRGPKGGKKDGRSDSLLIAEYMRRKCCGNIS